MATQDQAIDTSSFTPAQLAAYNNAASSLGVNPTITSNSLQGTTGIRLPAQPTDTTNYSGMINTGNALAGVGSAPTDTSTPDPYKLLLDRLDNTTPPPSAADQYNTDYASSGIDAKQATVNASKQKLSTINAQLAAITADVSKQQLQAASNPGDQQFQVERTQQQIARDAAIQAIPLQAQAMATQAELTNNTDLLDQAQTHLDKVFAIHAQDAQNQYNYKQKLYDTIYDFATKQQQAIIDKKKTEDAQNFQIQKDAINNQQALSRYATEQGQGTLAAQIGALDPKSSTYTHDLATLQSKIVDVSAQKTRNDMQAALAGDSTVSPNVLQGMLNVYKSTGVLPAFGLSAKSPLRAQFYAALGSEGGAQIVNDANANKSIRAGLNTAYRTQQNQYSAAQTAVSTLEQQLTLAKQYSDQVSRSSSPLVNRYLLNVKSGVFGDPETAALNNIVTTASYELAKIISGSSASIAGATVSSQEDAKNLLNSAMAKGQFNTVLDLMHKEATFRLNSQRDTLNQLQGDLNNVGNLTDALATSTHNGVTLPSSGSTYQGITLPH